MKFWMWWLLLIVVAAGAYVGLRMASARARGEDAGDAGRRALVDALPVVGAGIAGLLIFVAVLGVVLVLLLFLFIAVWGGDGGDLAGWIVVLLLLGGLALLGLPATAIVLVVRWRRRQALR